MNVTKNKIYLMVLGLAGLALLVDRVFLSGDDGTPQSASAGDLALPRANSLAPAEEHAEAAPIPELPFPRAVERFAGKATTRDVFAPPALPGRAEAEDAPENQAEHARHPASADAVGRAAFADRYRVTAIVHDEGLKIAVIDGRWLRLGATLDGCELIRIERRSAHFKCYDGEAILEFTLGVPD